MNLKINHRIPNDNGEKGIVNVKYFNRFQMHLKYDSMASTFSFEFYFNPADKNHAELACVSHFHEAYVEHNGERLISGFILTQRFISAPTKKLVQIAGYAKPGVMEDCEIPTRLYPLQVDGLTLEQITRKLAAPFRLGVVVGNSNANNNLKKKNTTKTGKTSTTLTQDENGNLVEKKVTKKIKRSTAKASENIKSFLTDLAKQVDVVLSHDEMGNIVLAQANVSEPPIAHFENGVIGTEMEMTFNGQPIHSHITITKQASIEGGNAGEYTIKNPYCPVAYVYRPRVIQQNSGDEFTVQETAANALAAELKNIHLVIRTDRWEVNGRIIRPNNTITAYNPEIFLYKTTTWFIESIEYEGDEKQTIATLHCVPVEAYSKEYPKNMFVNPHDNLPRFNPDDFS